MWTSERLQERRWIGEKKGEFATWSCWTLSHSRPPTNTVATSNPAPPPKSPPANVINMPPFRGQSLVVVVEGVKAHPLRPVRRGAA